MDLTDKLALAWDKAEILTAKNALYAGLAVGMVYVVVKTYGKMTEGGEAMGAAIGSSLADLQQFFNGSHRTEATGAGFVLLDKYVSSTGYVNETWRNAINQAHAGNATLFAAILNPDGRLKAQYMNHIGKEITPEVVS